MAGPKVFREALGYIKFLVKERNYPSIQLALYREATVGTDLDQDATARGTFQLLKDDLVQNYPEDHP